MELIPNCISNRIILDAIILKKRELWSDIHISIKNTAKDVIVVVVNINGTLYKYNLKNYIQLDGSTLLPKLRNTNHTTSQFYSAGYVSRVSGIDCDSLPYLNIDESDIILRYS